MDTLFAALGTVSLLAIFVSLALMLIRKYRSRGVRVPAASALAQKAKLTDLRVSCLELLAELPQSKQREEVISQWLNQSKDEVDWEVSEAIKRLINR